MCLPAPTPTPAEKYPFRFAGVVFCHTHWARPLRTASSVLWKSAGLVANGGALMLEAFAEDGIADGGEEGKAQHEIGQNRVEQIAEGEAGKGVAEVHAGSVAPLLYIYCALAALYWLPPCAQKMLAQGVADHQRVACFRLAVHLKKAGVPQDITLACLRTWASKNRPADGKSVICEDEIIAQVTWAYERNYRGCGCEEPAVAPFCDPACVLHVGSQTTMQRQDDAAPVSTS